MRTWIISAVVLALFAVNSTDAHANDPHEQLLSVRLGMGPAYGYTEEVALDTFHPVGQMESLSGVVNLALGYELYTDLVLHLSLTSELNHQPATHAFITHANATVDAPTPQPPAEITQWYLIAGPGLTYFLDNAQELFASASVGPAWVHFSLYGEQFNRSPGLDLKAWGLETQVGKQWHIHRDWSLGLSLEYIFLYSQNENTGKRDGNDINIISHTGALLFVAGFD